MDAVTLYDTNGNAYQGDGTGETIAIVDAYREPNIASDLAYFDSYYGLPDPPSFVEKYAQGTPAGNSSWGLEIALDVEYAHAMAPGANIVLVEAQTSTTTNLLGAEDVARNYAGVVAVTNSWGFSESSSNNSYDFHFTTPIGHNGVTFLASSGDTGGTRIYPAMSPNVISVGGTHLSAFGGNWSSESAWSGSGGGQSSYSSEPGYQVNVNSSGKRQGPDVSADADPNTGAVVYDTYGSYHGFVNGVGGTSLASPMWAGIIAVLDQGFALQGIGSLDGPSQTLYGLYGLAYQYYPYYDGIDYHDIQTGSAGGHQATLGYDEATGLGTPIGNNLIPDFITYRVEREGYRGRQPAASSPDQSAGVVDQGLTGTDDQTARTFHHLTNGDLPTDSTTPVVATGLTAAPAAPTAETVLAPVLLTQQAASPAQQDVAAGIQTPVSDNAGSSLVYSNAGSENGSSDLSLDSLNGDSNLL